MPRPRHPLPCARRADRRAFSLIEMLLGVCIVAALAVLIFAGSTSAVNQARTARCTSNLRTIGVALHAYFADNNGCYPPNRKNDAYKPPGWKPGKGNSYVQDRLRPYIDIIRSGTKNREAAGPWFCPADTERPIDLSADSYGQNHYLGSMAVDNDGNPLPVPGYIKPIASPKSNRLIYLVDHDVVKTPKSTAGLFNRESWPIDVAQASKEEMASLPNGRTYVHFRHGGVANALFVDGSVQALRIDDLVNTRYLYLLP